MAQLSEDDARKAASAQAAVERRDWNVTPAQAHAIEIARKQGFAEGYESGQIDAERTPTEFDLQSIDQSRRLACLKCATRMMGDSIGGTSAQVLSDAQVFFNWVTMTEEQRAQAAAVQAQPAT